VILSASKPLQKGWYRIYGNGSAVSTAIAQALLPEPERLISSGEELVTAWHAGNAEKGRFTFQGKCYFYKRYAPKGAFFGIKNIFRPSKALRAWCFAEKFANYAVPTIAPLLCMEKRRCALLGSSYLIFPFIEFGDNLLNLWGVFSDSQRLECMRVLGETIGKMHCHGILHGDLNWRNLLVSNGDPVMQVSIIDLDGCRYRNVYDETLALHDLKHFYRDMSRAAVSDGLMQEFQRSWQSAVTD